jgi:hypothetical protein
MDSLAFGKPHESEWVGGHRAGYIVYDSAKNEICRIWSEGNADSTIRQGYYQEEWLVDTVLARRFGNEYVALCKLK